MVQFERWLPDKIKAGTDDDLICQLIGRQNTLSLIFSLTEFQQNRHQRQQPFFFSVNLFSCYKLSVCQFFKGTLLPSGLPLFRPTLKYYFNGFLNILTNFVYEFVDGLNPVSIIKNSLHKLTHHDEIKKDVRCLGLNFGLDFLINKIFGRSKTLKDFVGTLFLKGVSGTILNTYSENIINYIKNIKLRKDKSDYTQN